jgi:fibronectin type 3 domain-containing protein
VSAMPTDRTPPAPPSGITVVPGVGRVFLTWSENKERDLAGYHVYRSTKSGGEAERLTEKPISRSTFSDESVQQGMTYFYKITAVDRTGNESAPSKEHKTYTEKVR